MPKKKETYPKKEAQQRFEAALRGSLKVGHQPMKNIASKNDQDPMPKKDPEALLVWAKRNIKQD